MMSYTIAWTCLWSIGGTLMRRTSPCTRIMGGRPADRCRSDALFLTTKASNSVRSITIPPGGAAKCFSFAGSSHYGNNRREPASRERAHRTRRNRRAARAFVGAPPRRFEDASARARRAGVRRRPARLRRKLRAGSARQDGAVVAARRTARFERRAAEHRMAPDRRPPEQQDARGRRALRLGADGGEREDRPPALRAAARGAPAAQRARAGQRFRRGNEVRGFASLCSRSV